MEGERLDRLIVLRDILDAAISGCESKRDLAALSRQYRDTLKEIEALENEQTEGDEISKILAGFNGVADTHSAHSS